MAASVFRAGKRASDVLLSAFILLAASPLLFLVAVMILVLTGPPVLSRDTCIGLDGRNFVRLRFRAHRYGRGPESSRLTPLGRRLRRSRLEYVPQLWNVLTGDMSLVGPMVLPAADLPPCSERQALRYGVRPGMTGPAQAQAIGPLPIERQLDLDTDYVETQSLRSDVSFLLRSLQRRHRPSSADGSGRPSDPVDRSRNRAGRR